MREREREREIEWEGGIGRSERMQYQPGRHQSLCHMSGCVRYTHKAHKQTVHADSASCRILERSSKQRHCIKHQKLEIQNNGSDKVL